LSSSASTSVRGPAAAQLAARPSLPRSLAASQPRMRRAQGAAPVTRWPALACPQAFSPPACPPSSLS
jgi:hypothetical protein